MNDSTYEEYCLKASAFRALAKALKLEDKILVEFDWNNDEQFSVIRKSDNAVIYSLQDEEKIESFIIGLHLGQNL